MKILCIIEILTQAYKKQPLVHTYIFTKEIESYA